MEEINNTPKSTEEVKVAEPKKPETKAPEPKAAPKVQRFIVNTKAEFLNVRSTPNASDEKNIVGRVGKGDEIETFGKKDGFYKIRYGGQDAWVMASKLRRAK